MRNLEAKFRLDNLQIARRRALEIGFTQHATILQHDTFFSVVHGKLKLREESSGSMLIHYHRTSEGALELSNYSIVPVADATATRAMLVDALGVLAEVRKSRDFLIRRNIRLHFDRVDGLGDFGEIEAVLSAGETAESYRDEVAEILTALAIDQHDLVTVSYFELASRA